MSCRQQRLIGVLLSTAVLLGLPLWGTSAEAVPSSLRLELAEVAKGIKQLLDGREQNSIAVGAFTGPSHLDTSAGAGIMQLLTEELQRLGVTVSRKAALEVKGDYLDVEDRKSQMLAARLKARVLDRSGTVIVEFERGVFGDATLPGIFGPTLELPPGEPPKARDARLRDSIDHPRTHIARSQVRAQAASPYGIEVLVADRPGDEYRASNATEKEGQAFVPIRRGQVYAVRLINDSDHEAAVTLTVDGINMFAFSTLRDEKTNRPKYNQVYVDPKSTTLIKGWFVTPEQTDQFVVTEYAKSAAAELKSTDGIGTITAVFAASWPKKDGKPPADEPASAVAHARSADATGRGPRITEKFEVVEQRQAGVIRAAVSVRYTK